MDVDGCGGDHTDGSFRNTAVCRKNSREGQVRAQHRSSLVRTELSRAQRPLQLLEGWVGTQTPAHCAVIAVKMHWQAASLSPVTYFIPRYIK